jgi:uncharacterized protein (TIGR03437 family)
MCDLFVSNPATDGNCPSAVSHQSGKLVTSTLPAAPGEIVTAWAVGLGAPSGGIPAGAPGPIAMNDITLNLSYQITVPVVFGTLGGSTGPSYLWAGLPTPNVGALPDQFRGSGASADPGRLHRERREFESLCRPVGSARVPADAYT